ncbi:MAG: geranylgeranylglyceryl/heptaprenylglyceryl phosphate synthase [Bacteroidota bacterium]|nr:geranylgeranylglyceryl/heptaprenylglyceryl phosphate synthase [Bacteroidota bacterium]
MTDELYLRFRDGKKKFAPLIDPDKYSSEGIKKIACLCEKSGVDFIFYGGSLLIQNNFESYLSILKENCGCPVILFPGSLFQISNKADGILLLSMISGRNPEMLIGQHVIAAPFIKASNLEVLPTGYILTGNTSSSVAYMSQTTPIPYGKDEIAASTAMAGEMLGLRMIYLEAGSGAVEPIPLSMIRRVRECIGISLIVGGGICNPKDAQDALDAGADVIVVGNALEKNPGLIFEISERIHK